jgi:hypothetical protein
MRSTSQIRAGLHASVVVAASLGSALALPAAAEPVVETGGQALLALAGAAEDDGDSTAVALRVDLFGTATWLAENGVEFGVDIGIAGEVDAPGRPAFGASVGACPTGVADCPGLAGVSLRGLQNGADVSGLFGASEFGRGSIESANVFVRGGWGEATLGRSEGVAARYVPAPAAIAPTEARGAARLDPLGLNLVRARDTITGPSAKLTLESQRLLAVKFGVSITPRIEARGLDAGKADDPNGTLTARPRDVVEVAASFDRPLWGTRLTAGLAYSRGDPDPALKVLGDDLSAWSGGLSLERGAWQAGVAGLATNQGLAGGRGAQSWSAGATRSFGDWRVGANGGVSSDNLTHVDAATLTVGASRSLEGGIGTLAFGWRLSEVEAPVITGAGRRAQSLEGSGVFLETQLRF